MNLLNLVNTVATVLTLVIIGVGSIAALIQLGHSRASNGLKAVLSLQQEFRSRSVQDALRFVQCDLAAKLRDGAYRRQLVELGFIDVHDHPELTACNWFDEMGTVLKNKMVSEDAFMDLFARLVSHYWKLLMPVVALMRRRRGQSQYHNFEYLAIRAKAWLARNPDGIFPKNIPRAVLDDAWLGVEDASLPTIAPIVITKGSELP